MVFNVVQIVMRKGKMAESGHGKLWMLKIGGSDSRTDFLLKFGYGFSEKVEGEEWVTLFYFIEFIKILMFVDVKWQKLESHVR